MTTNLSDLEDHPSYNFERTDIRDYRDLEKVFAQHKPDAVMHLAAESHVDRSIDGPGELSLPMLSGRITFWRFVDITGIHCPKRNNVHFDFTIYQQDRGLRRSLEYVLISPSVTSYNPSSYSASKASSECLVRAWGRTYNLPVVISNCPINYGPFPPPETCTTGDNELHYKILTHLRQRNQNTRLALC